MKRRPTQAEYAAKGVTPPWELLGCTEQEFNTGNFPDPKPLKTVIGSDEYWEEVRKHIAEESEERRRNQETWGPCNTK